MENLIKLAFANGWDADSENRIFKSGDISELWYTHWENVIVDGVEFRVPHYLERRLKELGVERKIMLNQIRDTVFGPSHKDERLDSLKTCSSQDVLNAANILAGFGNKIEQEKLKVYAIKCLRQLSKHEIGLKQAKDLIEIFMEAHAEWPEGLTNLIKDMESTS